MTQAWEPCELSELRARGARPSDQAERVSRNMNVRPIVCSTELWISSEYQKWTHGALAAQHRMMAELYPSSTGAQPRLAH